MSPETANQNPEQKARDRIDGLLELAGWVVQDKKKLDFSAGRLTRLRSSNRKQSKKPGAMRSGWLTKSVESSEEFQNGMAPLSSPTKMQKTRSNRVFCGMARRTRLSSVDRGAYPQHRPSWLNEDVPASWQADQFLHAYYYNRVKNGTSYQVEEFHAQNAKNPAAVVTNGLEWWSSLAAPPSDEDHNCHERAPVIRTLLSPNHIGHLTLQDFQRICRANRSTVDHVRRLSLEDLGLPPDAVVQEGDYAGVFAERLWSRRNQRGETVADLIRFVLDGGPPEALPERLYEVVKAPQRRIPHFGTNQLAEIVGWARPEICPPRNGRTSKGQRALGYNVLVH